MDGRGVSVDQTLFADWDSVASMIFSLRSYFIEHGTVPTWNFMFCGGHPELSVPFSWAYAWPSLFGYVLPPIQMSPTSCGARTSA